MRIIFEFEGGALDGKTATSDSADYDEARAVETFYWLTDHGAVGHSIDQAFSGYQVAEHEDRSDAVVVRCRDRQVAGH